MRPIRRIGRRLQLRCQPTPHQSRSMLLELQTWRGITERIILIAHNGHQTACALPPLIAHNPALPCGRAPDQTACARTARPSAPCRDESRHCRRKRLLTHGRRGWLGCKCTRSRSSRQLTRDGVDCRRRWDRRDHRRAAFRVRLLRARCPPSCAGCRSRHG